jgi:hypothetical protein
MTRPVTSTRVATNGADALAGSKPRRRRTNGSIEPVSEPKVTTPTSEKPTVSAGYLLVTGLIAVVVYRKLGLRMLRTMWINLDLIWGGALVVTGAVALLV